MNLREIRRLKAGDLVCDCRYKHLRAATVVEEFIDPPFFYLPLPGKRDHFGRVIPKRIRRQAFKRFIAPYNCPRPWDKDVILEDGANCSARHCLDSLPHPAGMTCPGNGERQ